MIEGVKFKNLLKHVDDRGFFMEVLKDNEDFFDELRQVSISKTKKGVIKAFHYHKKQDDCFYVLQGKIKVVLYDGRKDSPTVGKTEFFIMQEGDEKVLFIPRGVLHGYQVLSEEGATVLYIMNNVYDTLFPDEFRVPFDDPLVGFDWEAEADRKRILIIGASGNLGRQLMADLSKNYDVFGTFYKHPSENLIHLNIVDKDEVNQVISSVNPEIIIISSAMTNVEGCEKDPKTAFEINVQGVKNILDFSQQRKIIFLSTDSVFEESKNPYNETDKKNPQNIYGKTKSQAEDLVMSDNNFLIIRTARLFGPDGNKFINSVINNLKKNIPIKIPEGNSGNPTFLPSLSGVICEMIKRGFTGIYHAVGKDVFSMPEVVNQITLLLNLDNSLISFVEKDYFNKIVKRPSVILSTRKLNNEGLFVDGLREGLKKII